MNIDAIYTIYTSELILNILVDQSKIHLALPDPYSLAVTRVLKTNGCIQRKLKERACDIKKVIPVTHLTILTLAEYQLNFTVYSIGLKNPQLWASLPHLCLSVTNIPLLLYLSNFRYQFISLSTD